MCGLAHGCDYSDCNLRASELKLQKCLAYFFPRIVENTFKQWPTMRVFQPTSTGLVSFTVFNPCLSANAWGSLLQCLLCLLIIMISPRRQVLTENEAGILLILEMT